MATQGRSEAVAVRPGPLPFRHRFRFEHDLPYNPKHDQGYPSLGCVPCTEPVDGAESYTRKGRWGDVDKTECGLHTSLGADESPTTGS